MTATDNLASDHGAATLRVSTSPLATLTFRHMEIRTAQRQLLVQGRSVALGARAFDLLEALARRAGQLVSKNELLDLVWPDTIVEENNLAAQVSQLRKALGPEVIATVPGRGYRFAALGPPLPATIGRPALEAGPGVSVTGESVIRAGAETSPPLRTRLPEGLPTLIGRQADLARLGALVEEHRLVTLVGAGGTGKTRLAVALLGGLIDHLDRFPHRVCWVDLGPVNAPGRVPELMAAALGVPLRAGAPLAALVSALAPMKLLMALDNAEHLLAEVAAVVQALHEGAPGVHLLVTSQAPLKLQAERIYRLDPLAVPPHPMNAAEALDFGAVALFVERAQAVDARFALTDANVLDVIHLCRDLDGVALAIELAAARAPLLGLKGLTASLHQRLRLLTTSVHRHAPARQRTLRAALEWSHGFLDDVEQCVFRRMAVFAGSASLSLLQQVVADPPGHGPLDEWAALDALETLVDRSLVALVDSDAAGPRYRLLDSPRALALERLNAAGELDIVRRHHALAIAARFAAAWDRRYSGEVGWDEWALELEPDLDNARDAFAWAKAQAHAEVALSIMPSLVWALRQSPDDEHAMHAAACAALAEDCATLIEHDVAPLLQVRAWIAMNLVWVKSDPPRAREAARRAALAARACGDRFGLYFALGRSVVAHAQLHDAERCEAALSEMRSIEDAGWPPQRLVLRAASESYCSWHLEGGALHSLELIRRSLALYRAAGDSAGTVASQIYAELGADATPDAKPAAAAPWHTLRQQHGRVWAQLNLGAAWMAMDDLAKARATLQAGWAQAARFDMQPYFADHLALLAALERRMQASALLIGYAQARYERLGGLREPHEATAVERARTLALAALGDDDVARLLTDGAELNDTAIEALAFGPPDG